LGNHRLQRVQPELRRLLGPAGLRRVRAVGEVGGAQRVKGVVENGDLEALGPDIDAEDRRAGLARSAIGNHVAELRQQRALAWTFGAIESGCADGKRVGPGVRHGLDPLARGDRTGNDQVAVAEALTGGANQPYRIGVGGPIGKEICPGAAGSAELSALRDDILGRPGEPRRMTRRETGKRKVCSCRSGKDILDPRDVRARRGGAGRPDRVPRRPS
jgi:hypothetical protein